MCGIAGIAFKDATHPPEPDLIRAMTAIIRHRGPDDDGFLNRPGVSLGMRRLSIVDVAGGRQPIHSEDGSVSVVYNGEIYNYFELKQELTRLGHHFHTRVDTEVIVHGYEEYGVDLFGKLNGMFALAIWDSQSATLVLGRDRLGKKPLHYSLLPNSIIFGSEIKSLLLHPEIAKNVDFQALDDYITYGYVLSPRTIFEQIRKLEPACYLVWKQGELRIEQYWDVKFSTNDHRTESGLVEELRSLLSTSVGDRLMSDVPLGAFLSGGLDSSAVVAYMAQHMQEPVKTFSIGFEEDDFNELKHARTVARHLNTDHHEFIVRPNVEEDLPGILWAFDEPFADSSAIPTYYVSRMARDSVTVVLTGDGGDESFGGYMRYLGPASSSWERHVPTALRRLQAEKIIPFGARGYEGARRLRLSSGQRYADGMSRFPSQYRARLYTRRTLEAVGRRDSLIAVSQFFDSAFLSGAQRADLHRYLPDDILVKVDRMSMLSSLETRCPLLDYRLVEFMAQLPEQLKIHAGVTKYLLKQAMAPMLPSQIVNRDKMGFDVPLRHWLRGALSAWGDEYLTSERCMRRGLFRQDFVRRLVQEHRAGLRDHQGKLWTLICFEMWARTYLDGDTWKLPRPQAAPATLSCATSSPGPANRSTDA